MPNEATFEIVALPTFRRWIDNLRDGRALDRINTRLRRVSRGHFGDVSPVGDGVSEMRVHYGPGYRIYFIRDGTTVVVLLCGGDKDTQSHDIRRAKRLAADWRAENA